MFSASEKEKQKKLGHKPWHRKWQVVEQEEKNQCDPTLEHPSLRTPRLMKVPLLKAVPSLHHAPTRHGSKNPQAKLSGTPPRLLQTKLERGKKEGGGDDPTIRNFYTHQKHDLHSGNKKKTHPKNPTTTTNQTFERLQFAHPKSLKEG